MLISSDINYDFVDFTISQDVILGVFGNSKYNFQAIKINVKLKYSEASLEFGQTKN